MKPKTEIRAMTSRPNISKILFTAAVTVFAWQLLLTPDGIAQSATAKATSASIPPQKFAKPSDAADGLINALEKFDTVALEKIFGSEGKDIVFTGEAARDKELSANFVKQAREKKSVVIDPKNKKRAILSIGQDDFPFAIPIVKKGDAWSFDAAAGRQELLYRRIGSNELDAIAICHGFVEAEREYALQKRDGSNVNQYAQRIISTPGKQDGLAWKNPDGTWGGPVGERIAQVLEQGYTKGEPYHGYFFKVLKGQGPAARLGEMDFLVKGAMIGGFALVAAPAEYAVTGVKTFIVSHDGIVYEQDLGPKTLELFKTMERYNPDKGWRPVAEN